MTGRPLRLLQVLPSYLPAWRYGGPIRSVHGLSAALARQGHDVQVITTNVDGPGDSDVPLETPVLIDGVTVRYYPSQRLRRLYWSPPMARAFAEEVPQRDLLHLHSIFLWPTWAAARAARHAGVPYLVAPRGMLVPEMVARKNSLVKRLWLRFIERQNLEQAAGLHVTSGLEIEDVQRFGYHLPPCHLVPNGLDPDDSSGEPSPQIREIFSRGSYLLFLGRINWKKGLDRLIRALPQVTGAPLVIAGNDEEGYRPTLENLAREVGVSDRIIFTGPVAGADKQALLANAAVMAAPSYSENFGNVIIEAWSAGCPVVVTPEVGLAEVVAETGAGLVVDGNPELLAGALSRFLHEGDLREAMGQRGRVLVAERYTWDAVARQMEAVYRDILSDTTGYRQ